MFDFQQKRKFREWSQSRVLWLFLGVATVFVGVSAFDRYMIALDMTERREAVEAEVAALAERKAALEVEVDYLSNERGIEAEMRRQFDIAREGEQVVIIIENDEVATMEAAATTTEAEKPWYRFW